MITYFLQEYFGFTPSFAHAFFNGEPALKLAFFPLYVNTVILRSVLLRTPDGGVTTKALVQTTIAIRMEIINFVISFRMVDDTKNRETNLYYDMYV